MDKEKVKGFLREAAKNIIYFVAFAVAFVAAAIGWDCHEDTLSPLWIGLVVAFMVAGLFVGATYFIFGSKGKSVPVLTAIVVFLFAGGIAFGIFYGTNFYTAKSSERDTMKVLVTKKEHYIKMVSNRVGRRGASRGRRPVDHYELTLQLPDGTEHVIEIKGKQYSDIYKNREYDMPTASGCFGMKVMIKEGMELIGPEPRNHRDRRCRYVGPRPH